MRILVVHNRYRQKGGEDTTFEQEVGLLNRSHVVNTLIFQNLAGSKGFMQFLISVWNIRSSNKIRKAVQQYQPEIIHVHNWHYAIGPIIIRTAHKSGLPVVLTVQNFRLLCPSASLLFKNDLFLDSLHKKFPWKAIRNKIYNNSFLQTFWLSCNIWIHKKTGTWKMVDRYILQTELAKSIFISSSFGIGESKFVVKPNFISDPGMVLSGRNSFFLYIGRLSNEKGIDTLLKAFKNKNHVIYIGGDGPLKDEVLLAARDYPNIRYKGLLDKEMVLEMMSGCSALVFPSIWYEGMPLTIIEAFATGAPVIASNIGAMSSMIIDGYNGIHFTAGDADGLSDKLDFWTDLGTDEKKTFSKNARTSFESLYTPERNEEQLLSIYKGAVKNFSKK